MQRLIPQLLLDQSIMNLGHFRTPAQHLRVQAQRIGIDGLLQLHGLVLRQGLQVRIARPGRERQRVDRQADILKAGCNHPVLQLMVDVQLPATLVAGEINVLLPFHERGILLEGAIVAPGPHGALVRFKVAAGFDVVVDPADKPGPVGHASTQHA